MVPKCPECRNQTVVRKIGQDAYRCTNCGCGWTAIEQIKYYGKFDHEPPMEEPIGIMTPTGFGILDNLKKIYNDIGIQNAVEALKSGTDWRDRRDRSDSGPGSSTEFCTGPGTRKDGTLTDAAREATRTGLVLWNAAWARDKVIELYGYYPLPQRIEPYPIAAWKAAKPVKVWKEDEFTWGFDFYAWEGIGADYRYRSDDEAVCGRHSWEGPDPYRASHGDVPRIDCYCGFWAYNKEYAKAHVSTSYAILEVDLFGKVLVGEYGYRAQKQRVIAVHVIKGNTSAGWNQDALEGIVEQDGLELIYHDSINTIPFERTHPINGTVE